MNSKRHLVLAAMAVLSLTGGQGLHAQAVITSGNVILGVQAWGNLNVPDAGYVNADDSQGVGLRSASTGHEATYDGCPCEGWGAAVVGGEEPAVDDAAGADVFGADDEHAASAATSRAEPIRPSRDLTLYPPSACYRAESTQLFPEIAVDVRNISVVC